jgi:hypothetical protein
MGNQSLLPLFVAVKEQTPGFDWGSVDIVTDRNGLRKLLRWVDGDSKPFRIDLELAGSKTVLMRRWEARYQEQMSGYTFGFAFEKKMTEESEGCEGSSGHHRIVTYVRKTLSETNWFILTMHRILGALKWLSVLKSMLGQTTKYHRTT